MLFILGAGFLLVGIILIFRLIRNSQREKINAQILSVSIERIQIPNGLDRKYPHAVVEYYHSNGYDKLQQKIVLKSKSKIGDTIQVTANPKDISKVEEYYLKKDLLGVVIVNAIGIAILIFCIIGMDILER